MDRAITIAFVLIWLSACGDAPRPLTKTHDPADLDYHSDYVSFVGRDGGGAVAFALDVNRGRNGDEFQTELFGVLWDETDGWQHVDGLGRFPNPGGVLRRMPTTPGFRFRGSTRTLLEITSPVNGLTLEVSDVRRAVIRSEGSARFVVGSAAGLLLWRGREIRGRVIHESLVRPGWNRLAGEAPDLWRDFQGLYLSAGDGDDVYLHTQGPSTLSALTGERTGFARIGGLESGLDDAEVTVTARASDADRTWPDAWTVRWEDADGEIRLALTTRSRKVVDTRDGGGFAMGIVVGTMTRGGVEVPVIGLSELLD